MELLLPGALPRLRAAKQVFDERMARLAEERACLCRQLARHLSSEAGRDEDAAEAAANDYMGESYPKP